MYWNKMSTRAVDLVEQVYQSSRSSGTVGLLEQYIY